MIIAVMLDDGSRRRAHEGALDAVMAIHDGSHCRSRQRAMAVITGLLRTTAHGERARSGEEEANAQEGGRKPGTEFRTHSWSSVGGAQPLLEQGGCHSLRLVQEGRGSAARAGSPKVSLS